MSENPFRELWSLMATDEPAEMGPTQRKSVSGESQIRSIVRQFAKDGLLSSENEQLTLSLLLLWHDHLDSSHAISQGIPSAEGSMVHAMMHRREPDYWNSKYWWRQAGNHPVFEVLGQRVSKYMRASEAGANELSLVVDGVWNPHAFVDACESISNCQHDHPTVKLYRELQRIEFESMLGLFLAP